MKYQLWLAALMIASTMVFATPKKVLETKNAVITVCLTDKPGGHLPLGCVDKINIGGQTMHFDLDDSASKSTEQDLNAILGANRFHRIAHTPKLHVKGYISKEKGHLPNPDVKFNVFHIVQLIGGGSIPLPK